MDIEDRIAQNEALFRDVNERIIDGAERHGHGGFVCECGEADCTQIIDLTTEEYAEIRSDPLHFFVAPGHEAPRAENVVERRRTYEIVRKRGLRAEAIARADQG